jgi:hypothetical protein
MELLMPAVRSWLGEHDGQSHEENARIVQRVLRGSSQRPESPLGEDRHASSPSDSSTASASTSFATLRRSSSFGNSRAMRTRKEPTNAAQTSRPCQHVTPAGSPGLDWTADIRV